MGKERYPFVGGIFGNIAALLHIVTVTESFKEWVCLSLYSAKPLLEFRYRIAFVLRKNGVLVKILTEPRDSLVKQYEKLLEMDGVELSFEDDAVRAIAHRAIELKTGARGLRSIMEDCMMDTMYATPSDKTIEKIVITKDAIAKKSAPKIIRKGENGENIA